MSSLSRDITEHISMYHRYIKNNASLPGSSMIFDSNAYINQSK